MSTNNSTQKANPAEIARISGITMEAIVKMGLVKATKNPSKLVKTARDDIRNAGGYIPENASDTLTIVAGSVVTNADEAAKAGRKTALALALIDETEEYKRLVSPYGKPFKSTQELFRALFPSLADSTVRNYLNVGKAIYLPAETGTLPKDLSILNTLEPGTALSAVGAMNNADTRAQLPKAIKSAMGNNTKLTQSALKTAVKAAKEAAGTSKEDGTSPTAKKDEAASKASDTAVLRKALNDALHRDVSEGEIYFTIREGETKAINALINDALKDGESALLFVNAFKALING